MTLLSIVAVALLAGLVSGAVYGFMNILLVTPYIDRAVEIESSRAGVAVDIAYRVWQKQGAILAGLLAGIAYSALFSIVYAYIGSRSTNNITIRKGIILALIIWTLLYLMPALKYPANPPAVGDPETIYYRQSMYVAYMLISGIAALSLALLRSRMTALGSLIRDAAIIGSYVLIMVAAYMLMPQSPDAIDMPEDLLTGFRVTSAITSLVLWLMLGLTTSLLWSRTGLIRQASM